MSKNELVRLLKIGAKTSLLATAVALASPYRSFHNQPSVGPA